MEKRYIGIDLNEKYAMVSYYRKGMKEPGTLSMVAGSEVYQIPLCMAKKRGDKQWRYGEEAKKCARAGDAFYVDGLLKKSLAGESVESEGEIYDASELFFRFLKKLIGLPFKSAGELWPDKLAIVTETMHLEQRKLFGLFAEWCHFPLEQLLLFDYRESFYYYALNQQTELCARDVALYYYTQTKLLCWILNHDKRTIPQVVTIEEGSYEPMQADRDFEFAAIVEDSLSGRLISSVYLIGDGFDGNWMKRSLHAVCCGRRAFLGKNLFSKGACYAAFVKAGQKDWPYLYMGDNELKANVCLKVKEKGETVYLTLLNAGENWYQAYGECEVILCGSHTVDIWFRQPKGVDSLMRSVELSGMPKRPDRTTRLRIAAKPESVDTFRITIRDLGFGEIVKATEQVWEDTFQI